MVVIYPNNFKCNWTIFAIFLLKKTHHFLERTHQILTPLNVSTAQCCILLLGMLFVCTLSHVITQSNIVSYSSTYNIVKWQNIQRNFNLQNTKHHALPSKWGLNSISFNWSFILEKMDSVVSSLDKIFLSNISQHIPLGFCTYKSILKRLVRPLTNILTK